MSDKLKSLKNLQASFLMLSNKSIKNPLVSSYLSQEFMQSSGHVQSETAKLLKKYGHLYNKTETNIPKEKEEKVSKQRNNDYVKKIMFDNQELSKKIKEVERINSLLEQENKRLVVNYCEIRENYIRLKDKYGSLINEYGIELEDKFPTKIRTVESEEEKYRYREVESEMEIDVLNRLFKGASTESEILKFDAPIQKQQHEINNISDIMIKNCTSRENEYEIADLKSRRNTIFSFRKSHSITTLNVATQTEVPQEEISEVQEDLYAQNNSQEFMLSPSSRETELLMKIASYQTTMKELEKKNCEILGKYERIKSIISGELKGN